MANDVKRGNRRESYVKNWHADAMSEARGEAK